MLIGETMYWAFYYSRYFAFIQFRSVYNYFNMHFSAHWCVQPNSLLIISHKLEITFDGKAIVSFLSLVSNHCVADLHLVAFHFHFTWQSREEVNRDPRYRFTYV